MSSIRYEFIMSQIKHIRDIKENEKTKISFVFYEGCQAPCILKVCKNRDLSEVYQAIMEVSHPNLAMVYDCIYEDGNTYVVEEYIPGKTVAELIDTEGTFTEEETIQIISQLCDGLAVLHNHEPAIIHNDIKSSNIMVGKDGTVKLFDFDISRTYKEGSYKNTKLMGTYEYAAPEHYGFGQSEPCTDIYSLGVTMHEMLTGVALDYAHNVTYQGRLSNIIKRCVEIDRKKRYATAALLKSDLERTQKLSVYWWRILVACVCGALILAVGGLCTNNYWKNTKEPNGMSETESILDTEMERPVIDESEIEVDSELEEQESAQEIIGTEIESELFDNNIETEKNENVEKDEEVSVPKKKMEKVYNIQDTFLAMNAWKDGTFLLMEEISGEYYLRSSDGKSKKLDVPRVTYGAQLEWDSYTDQMYLLVFGADNEMLYLVTRELNIELVMMDEPRRDADVAFFSDGTMLHAESRYDCENWTLVHKYSSIYEPKVINDTLYSFQFIKPGDKLEYFFYEKTENWETVREFSLEDAGISFDGYYNRLVYNNSKEIYFIGRKDNKTHIFYFDGEDFVSLACLNDYVGFSGGYESICVTDDTLRYYSSAHKAIVEFDLNE